MRDSRPRTKCDRPYSLVASQLRSLRNSKQSKQWFTPARVWQHGGSGNFASDPQRASEEGKKGRKQSHQGSEISQNNTEESKRGGSGNFANDHEKALSLSRRAATRRNAPGRAGIYPFPATPGGR